MTKENKTIRQLLDQIGQTRDELRVKLHLAEMNLKQEWDQLEEKLRGIAKIEELKDEARLEAHLAKMEAKDELDEMRKTLDALVDGINRHGDEISQDVKDTISSLSKRIRSYRDQYKKSA